MDLLDLKFVRALSSEVRDGVRIVKAEALVQPVECLFCRAANPYRHDSREQEFADVARDVAVDVQTVRAVFQGFSEWLREHHPIATPGIMGVDEAKRAKVLCTVLTDLERRKYFDMLPSRKAKPLNDYLRKMPGKDRVEVVAMDCIRDS